MFRVKYVEKIDTHVLYSITFSENPSFCEIMWKTMVESDKQATAVRSMFFAFCIANAIVTHSEYALLTAFPQQQRFHERA
jgi:nitrogenase subunit NifH